MKLLRLISTVDGNKNCIQFGKAVFDLFFLWRFEVISSPISQVFMQKTRGNHCITKVL